MIHSNLHRSVRDDTNDDMKDNDPPAINTYQDLQNQTIAEYKGDRIRKKQ